MDKLAAGGVVLFIDNDQLATDARVVVLQGVHTIAYKDIFKRLFRVKKTGKLYDVLKLCTDEELSTLQSLEMGKKLEREYKKFMGRLENKKSRVGDTQGRPRELHEELWRSTLPEIHKHCKTILENRGDDSDESPEPLLKFPRTFATKENPEEDVDAIAKRSLLDLWKTPPHSVKWHKDIKQTVRVESEVGLFPPEASPTSFFCATVHEDDVPEETLSHSAVVKVMTLEEVEESSLRKPLLSMVEDMAEKIQSKAASQAKKRTSQVSKQSRNEDDDEEDDEEQDEADEECLSVKGWQFETSSGWKDMDEEMNNRLIDQCTGAKETSQAQVKFRNAGRQYRFDLTPSSGWIQGTQYNQKTKKVRKIRCPNRVLA